MAAPSIAYNRTATLGTTSLGASGTKSVGNGTPYQYTIPASSIDEDFHMHVDFSELTFVGLHATQDMTIKTNSSGAPTDTVVLKAGQTRIWLEGEPAGDNPFTADVTEIFVTDDSGGNEATLTMIIGHEGLDPA